MKRPEIQPLPYLSPRDAADAGYKSITAPINPRTESMIVHTITESMQGVDAVWIDFGKYLELGRQRGELAETPEH